MADREPQINISKISIVGIGGLGMVIMAAVVVWAVPDLQIPVLVALAGGLIMGGGYILFRRRRGPLNWDKTWQDKPESKFHHL